MKTGKLLFASFFLTMTGIAVGCGEDNPEPTPTLPPVQTVPVTDVTLSHGTLSLVEGESATITASVAPSDATDKTVTWSSSDASVATVNEGTVTAVKEGSATITAKAGDKSASCTVTVSRKTIPVESVTVDPATLEVTVLDDEVQLRATVLPENSTDKTVSWSSSDPSTVAVSKDGKVAGIKEGEAVITATAGSCSGTCRVKVVRYEVPVTAISLDKTTLTLTEGESATITASVAPSDATDKTVTWSSSDVSVATVNEGTVTAVKAGTAVITAKAGEKSAVCSVYVNGKKDGHPGQNEGFEFEKWQ